jgi:outer membrane receptor protein involved in Fe transport
MFNFSKELRAGVALLALTAAFGSPAFAQTKPAEQPSGPTAPQTADEKATDAEILVVGSRIRKDNFNSPSPVQIVTREESTLAGFQSTTEALQSTAVTGGTAQINNAFGGFVTNGGPGANTLGLRGLGATRTLILLNGRRIAPAGTRGAVGSADLNVLPNAIVDRFEILKDGASSIYGSDAIAGVVNIVTKQKMNGMTLEGGYAPTWDGGGASLSGSVVGGYTGDRFNITGSFEYQQRNALSLGQRNWTQCNTDYVRASPTSAPGTGDFVDPLTGRPKCYPITGTGSNGVTINTIGTQSVLGATSAPGVVPPAGFPNVVCNRFRPNSAVTTGPFPGFECVGGTYRNAALSAASAIGINLNVRDTFDPRTLNRSLISPGKVYTGYVQGSYDLQALGDAEVYFELLGTKRESSQIGYRQLSLDYAIGSPLIPSGLAGSVFSPTPVSPQITPAGVGVGVRAFIGFGNDVSSQKVEFWRVGGGLKGNVGVGDWRYDAYIGYSISKASYTFQSFLTSRLRQSLDVVASGSGFACRDTSNGCVAAPALTNDVIAGRLPTSWVNYVFRNVTGNTTYDEFVYNAQFDGSLFELPYGSVKAAIGGEFRAQKIDDTPAIESQNGDLFNLTSSAITRGTDRVGEVFGELEIPLLKNLAGAQNLTLSASARYTRYRSYGSGTTYKVGGIYTPFNALSLRATYGTSFRAPALFEQYLGATSGFLAATSDPCTNLTPASNSSRLANCASEGVGQGFTATQGVTVFSLGGANAGLKAETSKNFTAGLILQPKFGNAFGDLSFAVDYYNIQIDNGVAQFGASGILQSCYDDPNFRSANSQGYCQLVTRAATTGRPLTVNNSYINIASFNTRGIDYTIRYAADVGPGRFRFNGQLTQYLRQRQQTDPRFDPTEFNGALNNPKLTGTADFTYTYKQWTARYGLDWIKGTESYTLFGINEATSNEILRVPDYTTAYASVRYRGDKFEIVAGVQNLFDREPPQISFGRYNRVGNAPLYSGYDYVGRTLFVNVTKSF